VVEEEGKGRKERRARVARKKKNQPLMEATGTFGVGSGGRKNGVERRDRKQEGRIVGGLKVVVVCGRVGSRS